MVAEVSEQSNWVSQRDFAKLKNVSVNAISKACARGVLTLHQVLHRHHPMLDLAEASEQWEAARTQGHNNRYGELAGDDAGSDQGELFGMLEAAGIELFDGPRPADWRVSQEKMLQDALLAKAKHEKAKLELEELAGKLHRAEDVEAVWTDILIRFRQRVLGIPSKAAPQVARESDPGACQMILKDLVEEALSELSDYKEYRPTIVEARKKRKA